MKQIDRLTSLPHSLLILILSLLPIKSAAATSALSHRWRHLWTHITRLHFAAPNAAEMEFNPGTMRHILQQLTSPKIHTLYMNSCCQTHNFRMECRCVAAAVESCLEHVCVRQVEEIKVLVNDANYVLLPYFHIRVPESMLSSPSLIVLDLDVWIHNISALCLPKLEELRMNLDCRGDGSLMGNFLKSCPLLKVLKLMIELEFDIEYEGEIDISCPNLESLDLSLNGPARTKITVNAPKLLEIKIYDHISSYHFVERPTRLIQAYFTPEIVKQDVDHLSDAMVSQVIRAVCGVTCLDLDNINSKKIFKYLSSMQPGEMPIFCNLCKLKTVINVSDPLCWEDLLLSLPCFPNLEKLEVRFWKLNDSTESIDLSFVNNVPGHLLSKIKWLEVTRVTGDDIDVKLLRYILSKASVLERLVVRLRGTSRYGEKHIKRQLWKEYKFSKALFKLPRSSSACTIEFFGNCIDHASSDAFKNEKVTSELRYVDYLSDSSSSSTD